MVGRDQEAAGRAVRPVVWLPGLGVALGAGVVTAHGLFEVALAARVPAPIAGLYPLITDGLALVAYAATTRLTGWSARYAWAVVVLAAGLSGLAQATYLARPGESLHAATELRFGVGAWPAVAAAIAAHLVYLLATEARPALPVVPVAADLVPGGPVGTTSWAVPDAVLPEVPDVPGQDAAGRHEDAEDDPSEDVLPDLPHPSPATSGDDPSGDVLPRPRPTSRDERRKVSELRKWIADAEGNTPSPYAVRKRFGGSHDTAKRLLEMAADEPLMAVVNR